ncbi:putative single-stranded DNA-binding protein [Gordonia araii NBRC 100433]|uniref:Single-stranded DNA-binding protein n=1 Tax=Gordonia araii NBRC 100433 TaxID=1073574 RepID=G7H129_9ACTN|nr:single-stranded DNA-binding protein [Gordonia araii]NNG96724.1 single-stranded DNA-binding protein [Gordonia araii NBRC 100433]GAB09590.1 putative single-stranded DNA-binding protein [Gordonia araii NBRC 100433]
MFETPMTVVGNVISEPKVRVTSAGEVVSFRMASNSRRRDPDTGEWVNDKTLYLSVSCWRKLASGVAASLEKGRPIVAHGTVRTSEYVTGEGEHRSTLEMTATSVGLDLSRCIVKVVGFPNGGAAPVVEVVDPESPSSDGAAPAEVVAAVAGSEAGAD